MLNLLNEASYSKFMTSKLNIVGDQSNANYDVGSEIIYTTEYCSFNITIIGHQVTQVAIKNCGQFTKYITKVEQQ